jgi:3-deoxy-D-manno-octulosonate 8-phosphate phosphatase KdsC-like HAD superfamily phosphatase
MATQTKSRQKNRRQHVPSGAIQVVRIVKSNREPKLELRDKLAMTRRLLDEVFGIDIDKDNSRIVFVGDSPNDEPMFGYFENAVAVANFTAFADRVQAKPRWVTRAEGGEGFAELADGLLAASEIEVP